MSTQVPTAPATDRTPAGGTRPAPGGTGQPARQSWQLRWLTRTAIVAAVVALWWLSTDVVFSQNAVVSRMGPPEAIGALASSLLQPATWQAISLSLGRLLGGLALALAVGAPLGLLLGSSALAALAASWAAVLGTSAGRRSLARGTLEVARTLGATWPERLRPVVLPGVRPHIGTSFRVALGIGWVVLVPAEMFGVTNGLGYAV